MKRYEMGMEKYMSRFGRLTKEEFLEGVANVKAELEPILDKNNIDAITKNIIITVCATRVNNFGSMKDEVNSLGNTIKVVNDFIKAYDDEIKMQIPELICAFYYDTSSMHYTFTDFIRDNAVINNVDSAKTDVDNNQNIETNDTEESAEFNLQDLANTDDELKVAFENLLGYFDKSTNSLDKLINSKEIAIDKKLEYIRFFSHAILNGCDIVRYDFINLLSDFLLQTADEKDKPVIEKSSKIIQDKLPEIIMNTLFNGVLTDKNIDNKTKEAIKSVLEKVSEERKMTVNESAESIQAAITDISNKQYAAFIKMNDATTLPEEKAILKQEIDSYNNTITQLQNKLNALANQQINTTENTGVEYNMDPSIFNQVISNPATIDYANQNNQMQYLQYVSAAKSLRENIDLLHQLYIDQNKDARIEDLQKIDKYINDKAEEITASQQIEKEEEEELEDQETDDQQDENNDEQDGKKKKGNKTKKTKNTQQK